MKRPAMEGVLLVFLDFDGVLHPARGSLPFSEACLGALAEALADIPVELVVASSWREEFPLEDLVEFLAPLRKPVVGCTPVIDDPFQKYVRFEEVRKYLNAAGQPGRRWCAIDDSRGFYPSAAPVYWTDPQCGFTREDMPRFASFLRGLSEND